MPQSATIQTSIVLNTSTNSPRGADALQALRQKTASESGVEIRASAISGLGAFATRDMKTGEILAAYGGRWMDGKSADEMYKESRPRYLMQIYADLYLDAQEESDSNWTRYINSNAGTGHKPNVTYGSGGRIQVVRRIVKGQELTVSYGRSYRFS